MEKIEIETIINFNMGDKMAWIATRMKSIKTLMRKLGREPYRMQGDYACYLVPKSWIRISPLRKVSEKQRRLASERMKLRHMKKRTLDDAQNGVHL